MTTPPDRKKKPAPRRAEPPSSVEDFVDRFRAAAAAGDSDEADSLADQLAWRSPEEVLGVWAALTSGPTPPSVDRFYHRALFNDVTAAERAKMAGRR